MQVHPQQQVGLFLRAAVGPNMGTFISSGMGEVGNTISQSGQRSAWGSNVMLAY